MHYYILVTGSAPEEALKPYNENLEVSPYRVYLPVLGDEPYNETRSFSAWLASTHEYSPSPGLSIGGALRLWWDTEPQWDRELGNFYRWSTNNPEGKWDWYAIGGRFSEAIGTSDQLLKRDTTNAAVPYAYLHKGIWVDRGPSDDEWALRFRDWFDSLPDDELLTVVDIHR